MTRAGKRRARNTRILQKMWMTEQARMIDSKAGASLLQTAELQNAPDYKTRAYETFEEFVTLRVRSKWHTSVDNTNYLRCPVCLEDRPKVLMHESHGQLVCNRCIAR